MDRDWTAYTKAILRAEMARRHLTYQGLTDKLADISVKETEANVRNKITRGSFTTVFFCAVSCRNRVPHSASGRIRLGP